MAPENARSPIVYSFFSAFARAPRPIYFRLCSYWSAEISFRLRVISDGAKQVRLIHSGCKSPLCFPRNRTKADIFHPHFFRVRTIFIKRIKYFSTILDSNEMSRNYVGRVIHIVTRVHMFAYFKMPSLSDKMRLSTFIAKLFYANSFICITTILHRLCHKDKFP